MSFGPSSGAGAVVRIVVGGGSGLIGSKTVAVLRRRRHEVVAASPRTGVDTFTGAGLGEVLAGAHVVIDVSDAPSFEDGAVRRGRRRDRRRRRDDRPPARGGTHRRTPCRTPTRSC